MSFPQLSEVLWDWESGVELKLAKKKINDYEVEEEGVVDLKFQAVMQPMPPQKLLVKPEGQRTWKFWELWTEQFLDLDVIVVDGGNKTYRVMSRDDWSGSGFYHYEITEGVPNE